MGAAKELWMDEVEQVGDDYAFDKITRDEAAEKLKRLGFDWDEIEDMLDAALA